MNEPLCLLLYGGDIHHPLLTFKLQTFLLNTHFTSSNFIVILKKIVTVIALWESCNGRWDIQIGCLLEENETFLDI